MHSKNSLSPKERVKLLFAHVSNCYKNGISYQQKIPNEQFAATVQPVKIGSQMRSIGIIEQSHLVKLFFFSTEFPYKDTQKEEVIAFQVDGGKLCPISEQAFYKETLVFRLRNALFSKDFTVANILAELGPIRTFDYAESEDKAFHAYELLLDHHDYQHEPILTGSY